MSKNKWDRQDRQLNPQLAQATGQGQAGLLGSAASAQGAQAAAQAAGGTALANQQAAPASSPAAAPPAPPMEAIVLFNPTIELGEHLFVGTPAVQTKRLNPKLAYIVHGAIVIEEFNLILPLAGNFVRTT